jgi:hypothetical protein
MTVCVLASLRQAGLPETAFTADPAATPITGEIEDA